MGIHIRQNKIFTDKTTAKLRGGKKGNGNGKGSITFMVDESSFLKPRRKFRKSSGKTKQLRVRDRIVSFKKKICSAFVQWLMLQHTFFSNTWTPLNSFVPFFSRFFFVLILFLLDARISFFFCQKCKSSRKGDDHIYCPELNPGWLLNGLLYLMSFWTVPIHFFSNSFK